MQGAFGPHAPIPPTPIDQPQDGFDRPLPRYWAYPVGFNLPTGQPGSEGLKLVAFANLRAYCEIDAVSQACLTVRKEEILGIKWDIVPTDEAAKAMRDAPEKQEAFEKRRREMIAFWRKPDANKPNYAAWMNGILEDHFVLDAASIYVHPARRRGAGVCGSDVAGLDVLDGSTIKPLLDLRGGRPRPPNPAFSQYLWGISRRELIDMVLTGDIWEFSESVVRAGSVQDYSGDELLYLPYNTRNHTPYGFSLAERTIVPIAINIKAQQYALSFFTEGTIPDTWITGGPMIDSPEQVRRYEDALNAVAGDIGMMHKLRVLMNGSKVAEAKPHDLINGLQQVFAERVCMGWQVNPMEIGLMPGRGGSGGGGGSGLGGKGFGEQQENIQFRKATVPVLAWLKDSIFDFTMQRLMRQTDMEWRWVGVEPEEDQRDKEQALLLLRNGGIVSTDEVRVELGKEPWNLPYTSDPVYFTPTGMYPLTAADLAPETSMASGETAPPELTSDEVEQGIQRAGGKPQPQGTPLHQAQAASENARPLSVARRAPPSQSTTAAKVAETQAYRRYLRHGRDPEAFVPKALSPDEFERLQDAIKALSASPSQAIADRDRTLDPKADALAAALLALLNQLQVGQIGLVAAYDQARQLVADALRDAYATGAGPGYDLDSTDEAQLDARAQGESSFLWGLLQAVAGGLGVDGIGGHQGGEAALRARLAQWGRMLLSACEEAAVQATRRRNPDARFRWVTRGDADVCDFCVARAGTVQRAGDITVYPGDGGYGGPVCQGGPQCRCHWERVSTSSPRSS